MSRRRDHRSELSDAAGDDVFLFRKVDARFDAGDGLGQPTSTLGQRLPIKAPAKTVGNFEVFVTISRDQVGNARCLPRRQPSGEECPRGELARSRGSGTHGGVAKVRNQGPIDHLDQCGMTWHQHFEHVFARERGGAGKDRGQTRHQKFAFSRRAAPLRFSFWPLGNPEGSRKDAAGSISSGIRGLAPQHAVEFREDAQTGASDQCVGAASGWCPSGNDDRPVGGVHGSRFL